MLRLSVRTVGERGTVCLALPVRFSVNTLNARGTVLTQHFEDDLRTTNLTLFPRAFYDDFREQKSGFT